MTHRPLLRDVHRNIAYGKPLLRGWLHLLWFEASLVVGTLALVRAQRRPGHRDLDLCRSGERHVRNERPVPPGELATTVGAAAYNAPITR
jgi:hypothetical protein